jgi:hypothetical protein
MGLYVEHSPGQNIDIACELSVLESSQCVVLRQIFTDAGMVDFDACLISKRRDRG